MEFKGKERIAIIGSQGYIGSYLYDRLSKNYPVSCFSRRKCHDSQGSHLVVTNGRDIPIEQLEQFDIVIYAAGTSGFKACADMDLHSLVLENVTDIVSVASKMNHRQLLLYMSSAVVYQKTETDEMMYPNTTTTVFGNRGDRYSTICKMREEALKTRIQNTTHCALRLGTAVGVALNKQDWNRFPIAMLEQVRIGNNNGNNASFNSGILVDPEVWDCLRPVIALDDLFSFVSLLIDKHISIIKQAKKLYYNVCSFNTSVGEMAKLIGHMTNSNVSLATATTKTTTSMPVSLGTMDNTEMKELMDPFFTLKTAEEVVQDLIDNLFKSTVFSSFSSSSSSSSSSCTKEAGTPKSADTRGNVPIDTDVTVEANVSKKQEDYDTKYDDHQCCRVCGSAVLRLVLDLGEMPLANDFRKQNDSLRKYPLQLDRCEWCSHAQLHTLVPPEQLFSNYLYASGTNATIDAYFRWFVTQCQTDQVLHRSRAPQDGVTRRPLTVLEIASNDGSQLDHFKADGWFTVGVDPAENLCAIARAKGHSIICSFWGNSATPPDSISSCLLGANGDGDVGTAVKGTPDVIVAQNVLAHVPEPVTFLRQCVAIMDASTELWIQTSQCDMFRTGQFDTIYHEHISFFTSSSLCYLAEVCGLRVHKFQKVEIHGGSFLACLKLSTRPLTISPNEMKSTLAVAHAPWSLPPSLPISSSSNLTIDPFGEEKQQQQSLASNHCQEIMETVYHEQRQLKPETFWIEYRASVRRVQNWLITTLAEMKANGYTLIGYGAAAKGMTLLNYVNGETLEYIVDESPLKQNTFAPFRNVPVVPYSRLLTETRKLGIILLAWNFASEIEKKIKDVGMSQQVCIIQPYFSKECGRVYSLK